MRANRWPPITMASPFFGCLDLLRKCSPTNDHLRPIPFGSFAKRFHFSPKQEAAAHSGRRTIPLFLSAYGQCDNAARCSNRDSTEGSSQDRSHSTRAGDGDKREAFASTFLPGSSDAGTLNKCRIRCLKKRSIRTVPVHHSDGPLTEGCEPILLISIFCIPSLDGFVIWWSYSPKPLESVRQLWTVPSHPSGRRSSNIKLYPLK